MWLDNLAERTSPISANASGVKASFLISSPLRVYGWTVYSSRTSLQYILVFDASTLPADASVPLFALQVDASSVNGVFFGPMGRVFQQGLVLCNSSTDTTKTVGSADCFFDVQYDWLGG